MDTVLYKNCFIRLKDDTDDVDLFVLIDDSSNFLIAVL